jgi:hypothetical protein
MHRSRWRSELSEVHVIWLGLIGIFVFIGLVVVALSLLPVRDRR